MLTREQIDHPALQGAQKIQYDYLECACDSDEHTLKFTYDPVEREIHTSVFLGSYPGFFARIWRAVKYIFGYKSKYGHFDCFIMKEEDAPKLAMIVSQLMVQYPKGQN